MTELTPNQQRQVEKRLRKKKFADLAIQGTNSSSIASKRSVEALYISKIGWDGNHNSASSPVKQYFNHFVGKSPKRSPCINRGYWLRLHAIRSRIDCILDGVDKSKEVIVVNLGCGFDPLPFQILDKDNDDSTRFRDRLSFIDIDYSDLVQRKLNIIRNDNELMNIIGCETDSNAIKNKDWFKSKKYEVISCNMNDSTEFMKISDQLIELNAGKITIFIAEVSLAYMKHELADEIIKICSRINDSHFIMMEQLIPEGPFEPFSKQMLKHFKKNDSPLQSVEHYHTIESQRDRFLKLGFPNINIGNLLQLWDLVEEDIKCKIDSVEMFDELEEFQLFAHHYVLCHATNNTSFTFAKPYKFENQSRVDILESSSKVNLQVLNFDINTKFGAAILADNKVVYIAGTKQNRTNDTISLNPATLSYEIMETVSTPLGRACHSSHLIGNNNALIIGGRKAPTQGLTESWNLNLQTKQWSQGPKMNSTRYRHSHCNIDENRILIVGGVTSGPPFTIFNTMKDIPEEACIASNYKFRNNSLISAAIAFDVESQLGVIIGGGIAGTHKVSDYLMMFRITELGIEIVETHSNPLFQRYGSKCTFISKDEVLIVGGTSSGTLFSSTNSFIIYNLARKEIRSVPIPPEIWEKKQICFVGFELIQDTKNSLLVIGGGATCYGFGAISNTAIRVNYEK